MPTASCPEPVKPRVSGNRGSDVRFTIARAHLRAVFRRPGPNRTNVPEFRPFCRHNSVPSRFAGTHPAQENLQGFDRIPAAVFFVAIELARRRLRSPHAASFLAGSDHRRRPNGPHRRDLSGRSPAATHDRSSEASGPLPAELSMDFSDYFTYKVNQLPERQIFTRRENGQESNQELEEVGQARKRQSRKIRP
jgi:hypothetical protein